MPETPSLPYLPAFTVLPAHADKINLRALAQSNRYIGAQSKAQEIKGVVRVEWHQVEDTSVVPTSNGFRSGVALEEQDLDVAEILVGVAKEQHPTLPAKDTGALIVKKIGATSADTGRERSRKCPVTICPYHNEIQPWLKEEKDKHTMTHFEGDVVFSTRNCRYALRWPSFVEAPQNYFQNIRNLKDAIQNYQWWNLDGSEDFKCLLCLSNFDHSGYLDHLDGCIVHKVQAEALLPSPGPNHNESPPNPQKDQYLIKHYWPSLGCGWCYTDRCRCPQLQQIKEGSWKQVLR